MRLTNIAIDLLLFPLEVWRSTKRDLLKVATKTH